jgi:hypothetical protein
LELAPVIWADLARDAVGILIFLTWLAIPPAYVVILGRHYVRRCRRQLDDAESCVDELYHELARRDEPRKAPGRHHLEG